MSSTSDDWRDDVASDLGVAACLLCQKPTRSHVVVIEWLDERETFEPTTQLDDADALAPVCHGCYRDVDGDAARAVDRYESYLRGLCEANDVDVATVVDDPESVELEGSVSTALE